MVIPSLKSLHVTSRKQTYQTWVSSVTVAHMLSYTPRTILRKIKEIESCYSNTENLFKTGTYVSGRKPVPCYQLSQEGCQMLLSYLPYEKRIYFGEMYPHLFNRNDALGRYLRMDEVNRTRAYQKLLKKESN